MSDLNISSSSFAEKTEEMSTALVTLKDSKRLKRGASEMVERANIMPTIALPDGEDYPMNEIAQTEISNVSIDSMTADKGDDDYGLDDALSIINETKDEDLINASLPLSQSSFNFKDMKM